MTLCEKHGIPYRTVVFSFEDNLEAKQWSVDNQKARRNLDMWELGKIALKLKPDMEARGLEKKREYHGNQYENADSALLPNLAKVQTDKVDTRKDLADSKTDNHGVQPRDDDLNDI